ncbi:PDR/VanB family oxidoreductase [Cryptosporangium aurantiacum]|uniref:Ferredoxin-NADP reductase n=1 Tax=Cryptosporangium aurantiacum TaxID=134849 RepID=A0A1M7R0P3_9ACTN|nr:PDR/VanB family oxidoreductase [Cryptosporangium aurantiacum]SHN38155.1 Ferredoxin-NADP reductase [Cryptosporangium aurantiacum]
MREFEADLVVRSAVHEADGVLALTLGRHDGSDLPDWTPGAHIDLVLGEGLVRQYSLCGRTGDTDSWRVAVLRAPDSRGGSVRIHALEKGSVVRARGPRNHFPVVASRRYLFLAGGIGITPLLAMINEVDAAGAEWELYYGGRQRESMAFTAELARFGDRVRLVPEDEQGLLDLDALLGVPRADTLVYACGPERLLQAVEERCASWPAGSLHLERFAPRATEPAGAERSFEVVLEQSGTTLEVPPDKSVFEVVREAGVSVLGSCLEGICGTCETEVIDGDVDHRDSVLSDDERETNEVMMICVSRCTGPRLTLAL